MFSNTFLGLFWCANRFGSSRESSGDGGILGGQKALIGKSVTTKATDGTDVTHIATKIYNRVVVTYAANARDAATAAAEVDSGSQAEQVRFVRNGENIVR